MNTARHASKLADQRHWKPGRARSVEERWPYKEDRIRNPAENKLDRESSDGNPNQYRTSWPNFVPARSADAALAACPRVFSGRDRCAEVSNIYRTRGRVAPGLSRCRQLNLGWGPGCATPEPPSGATTGAHKGAVRAPVVPRHQQSETNPSSRGSRARRTCWLSLLGFRSVPEDSPYLVPRNSKPHIRNHWPDSAYVRLELVVVHTQCTHPVSKVVWLMNVDLAAVSGS